ncbi:membrane protein [Rhodopirellula maiorica SM1]|uniref:Membrane protein n=1 Tax=Rhodopirellula maiorica SM1 TaxID=1265738 RepID=M5RNU3_9BACT|nr:poly-gamma-glutamate biosynthesis protein PgsC [Rhodopirellula maiorica]EMI17057.1 membrane protein [Rhodopirellula maiorica SM1]
MDTLTVSIGIGLAVSLLFSETFGLAAGGMVVPGYIALSLDRPVTVIATFFAAIVTYFIVYSLSNMIVIYGKRRTVLMVLVGFLVGILMESLAPFSAVPEDSLNMDVLAESNDYEVIGYIIPGLIAIWIDRQGMLETLGILLTAATVVRLVLMLIGLEFVL